MTVAIMPATGEREGTSRKGLNASLLLKAGLSIAILVALFAKFRHDMPTFRDIDLRSASFATVLLLLQPPLIGLRWWMILRLYGSRTRLPRVIGITWISVFANQFLPASVGGDAIRIYAARRDGERLGSATASVLMDRLIALFALAVLVVGFSLSLRDVIDLRLVAGLGALCAVGLAGAIALFRVIPSMSAWSARWPMLQKLLQIVHYVLRIISHPAAALATVALAIAVHILSLVALLLIAQGVGAIVEPTTFIAVASLLTFVQVIPISIGGWGVREAAAVTLFGLIGIGPGPALLSSVVLGLSYAVASLPGALIWPFHRSQNPARRDSLKCES
jgi:uncharacterized membrane protein YbhN (UPF0104 family)